MPYTPRLRKAVGEVRAALEQTGLERQSTAFARHGSHEPAQDAPLVLVACSGGRDSTALAAVTRTVCGMLGLRAGAVIVDHDLQSGSAEVAQAAASRCRSLGLNPVVIRRVDVNERGEGLEAAAREARYHALTDVARDMQATAVLLAHTMDDQAETVAMGLLRSRGIDAIAGMPSSFRRDGVMFVRPLLHLSREETTGICEDLALDYWDDPTNGESLEGELPRDYPLRSRVRHDLLPAVCRFAGADITRRLAQSAELARRDKDFLDQCADRALAESVVFADRAGTLKSSDQPGQSDSPAPLNRVMLTVDARKLAGEHPAIRQRVIAHALNRMGIETNAVQTMAIDRLIVDWHGQGPVHLSSGYSANRKKHVIRVCQDGAHANR
ncbi:tRNA lysidine(34) synthetase TilS [Bifidobacterium scaligerum]|uniref:tRNA(Ile)-lysidine synthase n=1 Tax=Bifidobacterium scaligerum TaxID=2052656 RepID=A0A2M9HRD9_9BIFI|nr:tRNA lysidine(34) synthetase TilS [Bifidobacterium scaligerum]PJM79388.1 tRNA lysidine(34) synthetase TilS [Bifidobacterium scaligerum]